MVVFGGRSLERSGAGTLDGVPVAIFYDSRALDILSPHVILAVVFEVELFTVRNDQFGLLGIK